MNRTLTLTALCLTLASFSDAQSSSDAPSNDWPRFRGPHGAGTAGTKTTLPLELSEAREVWRVSIPKGYSSPIVQGEFVYLTAFEDGTLLTLCYDLASGKETWRQQAPTETKVKRTGQGDPAAPTPIADDQHLFVLFQDVGLLCYTHAGDLVWHTEIGKHRNPHGMATSPVLADELLVIQIDADSGSSLRAYHKKTGKLAWETVRPGVTYGYSTPAVFGEGKSKRVLVSGAFQIECFELESGKRLWSVDGACWNATPIPIVHGDHAFVLSCTGSPEEYRAPRVREDWKTFLKQKDADGDGQVTREEWGDPALKQLWFLFDYDDSGKLDEREYAMAQKRSGATGGLFALDVSTENEEERTMWVRRKRRGLPEMVSPIVVNETLFCVRDGLVTAFDPTSGDELKQERIGDTASNFASPISDGKNLLFASQAGKLTLVSAERDFEVLSSRELDDETIWATPALAHGKLVVRTQSSLWCFDAE